jgi:hypothetical protein
MELDELGCFIVVILLVLGGYTALEIVVWIFQLYGG